MFQFSSAQVFFLTFSREEPNRMNLKHHIVQVFLLRIFIHQTTLKIHLIYETFFIHILYKPNYNIIHNSIHHKSHHKPRNPLSIHQGVKNKYEEVHLSPCIGVKLIAMVLQRPCFLINKPRLSFWVFNPNHRSDTRQLAAAQPSRQIYLGRVAYLFAGHTYWTSEGQNCSRC